MSVIVSMLRAVNVGPHNRIRMEALRGLYESLGLEDPRTYLQSGNVVFRSKANHQQLAALARRIEHGFQQAFGFHSHVILRTPADLTSVIARNPFAERPDLDPKRLLVTFLSTHPPATAQSRINEINAGPEELWLDGRELYIYYPEGMGRTKLTPALLDRALEKTPGTARNWNTVTALLDLANSSR